MSGAWHRVTSESEAASLLEAFGSFHDSCLKEALVSTEAYVASNLAMQCPDTLHNKARLLFQRQGSPISALELVFAQVTSFHLRPAPEGCDAIISHATLSLSAGVFIFAAYVIGGPIRLLPGQEPPPRSGTDGVFVSGRELLWREAPGWLGPQARYGALENRA